MQDVAENVRAKFEQKLIPKEELAQVYSKYNPWVDGEEFVVEAEKIFPRLNCGLTSVYLQRVLGGEVVRGQYDGHNHTYLLLDGEIVDITADQYGGPKIYVGEFKLPWTRK